MTSTTAPSGTTPDHAPLSNDRPLPPESVEHFDRFGWVLAPALFSPSEVTQISEWIDELAARPEQSGRHWVYHQPSLTDPSRSLIQRIENFCPFHPGLDGIARHSRLTRASAQLLGEEVALFKEKINFKEPGGAGFDLHQDQQAGWSRYAPLFVTAMICIDPATIENGCLEVARGLDRPDRLIADEWRPVNDQESSAFTMQPVPTEPGDALFFDSYFPHASKANRSPSRRRILFMTYNALSFGDQRGAYHTDKYKSFPPDIDRAPGDEYRFRV
ncbi:MAG: phytanoyl-CoA dioxygenase family protein [Telmatospirillum sp.]|nr:phytanoyl-CoA dioxygenase family protein [Telmatospirillum sp.]